MWDSMRDLLSSFLWSELVYTKSGKDVFDSILSQRHIMCKEGIAGWSNDNWEELQTNNKNS